MGRAADGLVPAHSHRRGLDRAGMGSHVFPGRLGPLAGKGCVMSVDLPPSADVAAIIAPQETEKRKTRGGGRATAIAIGTVLILSDGSECVVAGFDAQGNPLCHPLQN